MNSIVEYCNWLVENYILVVKAVVALGVIVSAIIGVCSAIVKGVPVLSKDSNFLPAIKMLGKLSLNKSVKEKDRPKKKKRKENAKNQKNN